MAKNTSEEPDEADEFVPEWLHRTITPELAAIRKRLYARAVPQPADPDRRYPS